MSDNALDNDEEFDFLMADMVQLLGDVQDNHSGGFGEESGSEDDDDSTDEE